MSKKIAQSEHDEYASAGGFIAPAAIGPVYADSLAAANSFRQYQWYLDGRLTVGGNVNGANVDFDLDRIHRSRRKGRDHRPGFRYS